ncbi:MAG: putative RNA methylase [Elusimicrobia bacterium]|nr:MAG: putative RNA methylase [Elusimicrobiota bacterium]
MPGWTAFDWSLAFCWTFVVAGLLRSFFFIRSMLTGAPSVPSSPAAVEAMCALADLGPGKTVYDLGSGAGRLLFAAAALGARAVGLELDPFKVVESRLLAWASPDRERITVLWRDFRTADFAEADVVFVYLTAGKMAGLLDLLKGRLKPGALVVSNSFVFPGLKPERTDEANKIYTYRAPLQTRLPKG